MSLVKKIFIGASTLTEWFGSGMAPVEKSVAEHRSEICYQCPMNKPAGLFESFGEYAHTILGIRRWLKTLGCQTIYDLQLHVCKGCNCPMRIKVWVPLNIIKNHLPQETINSLHQNCWIKK